MAILSAIVAIVFSLVAFMFYAFSATTGRPPLLRTALAATLLILGLSHPILFEYSGGEALTVLTRTEIGGYAMNDVVWCPTACVNIPRDISVVSTLPNGIRYVALVRVLNARALAHALEPLPTDEIVSIFDVRRRMETPLGNILTEFLDHRRAELMARNPHNNTDAETTAREFNEFLRNRHPSTLVPYGVEFASIYGPRG